ncbi:M56 family metallopeptidase [Streptomyces sp. NBC_00572]|uniref:M56 family metallopeptidase n=1 Tax=Streptomyces sp. NBC_00572 TaxID=2903664 RepID=UPI0022563CD4|nr:M56 family metallopeptidase [Streptomyces sp. NBC_00572]MCX4984975.1 M56 family metallopeptidase [Streptomyces sp. NBC_00572]
MKHLGEIRRSPACLVGLVLCLGVTIGCGLEAWHIGAELPRHARVGGESGFIGMVDTLAIAGGLAVALVSVLAGSRTMLRCLLDSAALSRWVSENSVPPCERLSRIARSVAGDIRVAQIDVAHAVAVTHRAWRPRIAISSMLVARTSDAELAAVLRHEAHHARRRHPLGRLAAELASSALWFLPALRTVGRHAAVRQELSADRAALSHAAPSTLAGALVKALAEPEVAPAGTLMGDTTTLEARVHQLEHGPKPLSRALRCHSLRRAVLLLCTVCGLLVYGTVAAAGRGLFTPLF